MSADEEEDRGQKIKEKGKKKKKEEKKKKGSITTTWRVIRKCHGWQKSKRCW